MGLLSETPTRLLFADDLGNLLLTRLLGLETRYRFRRSQSLVHLNLENINSDNVQEAVSHLVVRLLMLSKWKRFARNFLM